MGNLVIGTIILNNFKCTIYDIMLDGCRGYNNMTDEEINELYEEIFGKDA